MGGTGGCIAHLTLFYPASRTLVNGWRGGPEEKVALPAHTANYRWWALPCRPQPGSLAPSQALAYPEEDPVLWESERGQAHLGSYPQAQSPGLLLGPLSNSLLSP